MQPTASEASEADAESAARDLIDSIVEAWEESALRLATREFNRQQRMLRGFQKRLTKTWGKTFRLLRALETISFQAGAELNANSTPATTPLRYVLLHLHARAIRVFSEVRILLESGYADGAHARWRTLHETAVVAVFLRKHGDEGALLYLEHEAIESCKAAIEYQKHAPALGYQLPDAAELAALQKQFDSLVAKHGGTFQTAYGWAAVLMNKPGRPGIEALEVATGLDRLRPFYRMASHAVHANPKSFQFSLAQPDRELRVRLAGPGNAGLADPAHCAAISLTQVTAALLVECESIDAIALVKLLDTFVNQIGEAAIAAHRHIESLAARDREFLTNLAAVAAAVPCTGRKRKTRVTKRG
ncbi:MAG TPA: DUF5677 domain-containing protein [Phycisphaerales bacterium]|nr:DUF5677 domain-containing protein [Phycisphaerales bacterium]